MCNVFIRQATRAEIPRCLEIRIEVFVNEQKVPHEEEIDALDDVTEHFLAFEAEGASLQSAMGTARLQVMGELAKAQRVAVQKKARGTGVGRALMLAIEDRAREQGCSEMKLGAQVTAMPFYESIGYEAFGDLFDDAGIPHKMMRKRLLPNEA